MTQNPMVAEVNRLLMNLFAAGESVALPSVGTLVPVKRPARRISKRQLLPPLREIDFKSDLVGKSLAERLVVAAHCTQEQAEEIYGRWLGYTFKEGVLTLEGIGVLRNKSFKLDPAFDQRLNPQGRQPIALRVRRRGVDWAIWLGVVAVVAAVAIGLYAYNELKGTVKMPWEKVRTTEVAVTPVAEVETPTPAPQVTTPAPEPVATPASAPAPAPAPAPKPVPVAQPRTEGVHSLQSGHFYVVLGVFSTEENAKRATTKAVGEGLTATTIYRFGQKFMVSPFTAADSESCAAFRRTQGSAYPDMWVYKAR